MKFFTLHSSLFTLLLALFLVSCQAEQPRLHRVIISTDIGGTDPDDLRQPLDGRNGETSGKRRSPGAQRSGWWRSQPPNPDRRESEAVGENKMKR